MDSIEQSAMTNEQPEQWAVELRSQAVAAEDAAFDAAAGRMSYECALEAGDAAFALAIQRAFTEHTADLVAALVEARSGLCAYSGGHDGACSETIARIDQALAQQDKPDAK